MNERTSIASYTAADLDRYHTGQMSPAERHALEKAALEDPFLSDAIEGYSRIQGHGAEDARSLRQRLKERTERNTGSRGRGSIRWLNPMWQVAAMVVILAGAALLVFRVTVPKRPEEIAQERPSVQKMDSVSLSSPTAEVTSDRRSINIEGKKDTPEPRSVPDASKRVKEAPMVTAKPDLKPNIQNTTEITAAESQPIPDQQEHGAEVARSAAPAPAVTMKLPKKAAEDTPLTANDNEADARGLVTETRKKAAAPASGMTKEVVGPQPKIGWEAFRNYLTANRVIPAERTGNTDTSSTVLLSFSVDRQGRPTDIRIERSLCPTCDREAVRLITEGPAWQQGSGGRSRALVQVPF